MQDAEQVASTRAVLAIHIAGPILDSTNALHEGVVNVLAAVRPRFGRIFLVSRGSVGTRALQRVRLHRRAFHRRTGIRDTNIVRCPTTDDLAELCTTYGVTHLIESSAEVFSRVSVANGYLFRPDPEECANYPEVMRAVFDPLIQPDEDADTCPITVIRAWDDAFMERLFHSKVLCDFRRSQFSSNLPRPMPLLTNA